MRSVDVFFRSIAEIKEFADIASSMKGEVTLSDKDGMHSVDAKSVMGILCLNLSRILTLEVENWEEKYGPLLSKYIVRFN